jgi:hypothetical protein
MRILQFFSSRTRLVDRAVCASNNRIMTDGPGSVGALGSANVRNLSTSPQAPADIDAMRIDSRDCSGKFTAIGALSGGHEPPERLTR